MCVLLCLGCFGTQGDDSVEQQHYSPLTVYGWDGEVSIPKVLVIQLDLQLTDSCHQPVHKLAMLPRCVHVAAACLCGCLARCNASSYWLVPEMQGRRVMLHA